MKITSCPFGTTKSGKEVALYRLTDETGSSCEIISYGAAIRSLTVPDRNGVMTDVVLGYDTLLEYEENKGYLGACIGRFGNRIGKGEFELNGKKYTLFQNDHGNHLHGGKEGFNQKIWDCRILPDALECTLLSPDGEEGYPGNLSVTVRYTLKDASLSILYRAQSDADTVINLTNHAYFNLDGKGDVNEQKLTISADAFLEGDDVCLPTGRVMAVENTAMDFRLPRAIGEFADGDEPCVKPYGGYDHNFVLNGILPSCTAYSEKSGIYMTVETDQPGVQLYTCNHRDPWNGKGGDVYGHRSAFCLETQHFPDSIHHPEWESPVLRAGDVFFSQTTYSFFVK